MSIVDLIWIRKGSNKSKRFVELDLIRGVAIFLMIVDHIFWDLEYFNIMPMSPTVSYVLQRPVPIMFFIIVGISIIAGRKKKQLNPDQEKKYYENLIIRGLKIFNFGMFLTIVSFFAVPERPVFFGVLHCIGISIVLSALFLKYRVYNFIFSGVVFSTSLLFSLIQINNASIIHLAIGVFPDNFLMHTIDYFPIVPWFGFVLLGIAIGDCLYCGDRRRFRIPDFSKYKPAKFFSWVGQHSLEIYLLHQPVIAGFLFLFVRAI